MPTLLDSAPPQLQDFATRNPRWRAPISFAWTFANNWGLHQCPLIAGALAYFGLVSVFPVALAAVTILAGVLRGNTELLASFTNFVQGFFPGQSGSEIAKTVTTASENVSRAGSGTLNLLALGALLWSGRAYFDTLASVLSTIFPRAQPRTFVGHQIALWSTFLGAGALFVLSTMASAVLSTLQSFAERVPNFPLNRAPGLWALAGRGSSFLLTLLMFWLMFRFLPNVQGRGRRGRLAFVAALVSSVGWELAKIAFARLLPNITTYEATYGSVAGVVVTMLWLYFASLLTLIGAEFAGAWEAVRGENKAE